MRKQHAALKFLAMLVLLCTISAALASCGSTERKPEFYSGSTKIQLYGDSVYILKDTTLYARLLHDPEMGEVPVCADSLCSHNDETCPLFFTGVYSMILDRRESDKNKSMPVMYFAYQDMYWDHKKSTVVNNGYAIKRYDAGKNVSTDIVKGYTDSISEIYIYGDTIYYRVFNTDSGFRLEAVDKNGGNHRILDCEHEVLAVRYADENNVLCSDTGGKLYQTDPALSKSEFLIQSNADFGLVYISGGYVYYPDDISVYDTIGEKEFRKCSVYRIPIMKNADAAPECVLNDVFYQGSPIGVMDDKHFVFAKPEVVMLGSAWKYDVKGEVQSFNVYANNSGNIYAFNTEDGTVSQVIDADGYDVLSYFAFTEDYAIFAASKLKEIEPDTPYAHEIYTLAYSFTDRSVTVLD